MYITGGTHSSVRASGVASMRLVYVFVCGISYIIDIISVLVTNLTFLKVLRPISPSLALTSDVTRGSGMLNIRGQTRCVARAIRIPRYQWFYALWFLSEPSYFFINSHIAFRVFSLLLLWACRYLATD